jgi:hypothetical protein
MKKTLDKIRIHPEGWKIFLDKLGISSREKAAGPANHSWELSAELGRTRQNTRVTAL